MPPFIVEFFASHWRAILISVIILGGITYVEGLRLDNAHLTTQVSTLKADNSTLTTNNTKLEDAISVANKALAASDKAAKDAAAKFDVIQHNILQQQAALKHQLAGILQQKDPRTCNDAILFLIDNVKGYAK